MSQFKKWVECKGIEQGFSSYFVIFDDISKFCCAFNKLLHFQKSSKIWPKINVKKLWATVFNVLPITSFIL